MSFFAVSKVKANYRHICVSLVLLISVLNHGVGYSQCSATVTTFPYVEDFETGTGNWFSGGNFNDWAWGTPNKPVINSAGSGTNCWIVGGLTTSIYASAQRSWVQSPCFDFSGLVRPVISFLLFWELEYQFDGGNLQYSTDGGQSWVTLGTSFASQDCIRQNWYNTGAITNLNNFINGTSGWSGTIQSGGGGCRGGNGSSQWVEAKHCIAQLAGEQEVIFRFTFGSGTTCNSYDGLAFDLFKIEEAIPKPFTITPVCVNSNTIRFSDNDASCHSVWNWNFGDAASTDNTSSALNPGHTFSASGTYTVSLTASAACIAPIVATVDVHILDTATATVPVTCEGGADGQASISVFNPPGIPSYSWNTNPVQTTAGITGLSTGVYSVSVQAQDACPLTATLEVNYGPEAFPVVDLGEDRVICSGETLLLNAGSFAAYQWQNGTNDSVQVISQPGRYAVEVMNNSGCIATDSVDVLEDCLQNFIFPNAFTPNADGINDLFSGYGLQISDYLLQIYNRWGGLVFESQDPQKGWDGSTQGRAQQSGVYVYRLRFKNSLGKDFERIGSVTLLH